MKKNKNDFKEYIEIKLFLSSYFTRLCPSVFSIIKNIDYQQINWEYVLSESTISKAFIPDLPRNFKDVDYTTIQSIILQGKQFETSNMHFSRDIVLNHLQQDVLKQLEKFKANNNKKLISENQVSWFLQAEHLQWMSHAKKVVIDLKFEDAQAFNEGLAPVKIDGKWGYINLRGNFEIAPYLDIATPFSEGLAAVRKKYLWGYIDKNNQIIIPFEFDFAYPFDNKKAQVMKGTSWFYINTNGKTI